MELKLGELLLREKLITAKQLEEALNNQAVYGIRLGSALVEMGYVKEDTLAHTLSEMLGVPFVGGEELASIPKEVIKDFSRALVIRYQVIPFKLERNRLGLAMTNPNDFKAIEDIAFITGHVVQPYIAPDICISHAQARYYRFSEGEARYQQITRSEHKRDQTHAPRVESVKVPAISENGEKLNVHIPAEFEDFASLNDDIAEENGPLQEKQKLNSFERTCIEFAEAHSREDVADALIRFLGRQFGICALFVIRGEVAEGWRGINNQMMVSEITGLNVIMSRPSVLRDVSETKKFFLGHLATTPENQRILEALALTDDAPLYVAPVIMMDKVVVAVLALAETEELGPRLNRLQMLLKKMALAFEMLVIKNKILTV